MTTALFLPFYDDNPYQDELARGLEDAGVQVVRGDHETLFPVLGAFLEHGRPDVLHLHWAHALLGSRYRPVSFLLGCRLVLELVVAKLLGVEVVWTVHNKFHHERHVTGLERTVRHLLCRLADAVVVHGEAGREAVLEAYDLPDRFRERVHVIPHGNYLECYPDRVTREAARERLGLPADATVLLHVGNIRPYKNVPGLIETFRDVPDRDARLLVVGRPPADDEARRRLEADCRGDDRVDCDFGFVPADELQVYLNAADAVVLPFEDVLTSGSVVLALSFGRPVIAPRLGCIPETVGDCDDLLYDPDEPGGLAAALERALESDLDRLGRRAARRAEELDWESIGRRTAAVYERPRATPASGVEAESPRALSKRE